MVSVRDFPHALDIMSVRKPEKYKIEVIAVRYLPITMLTPDTSHSETDSPGSLSVPKSCCYLDKVSVLKDSLEERCSSDLVDEEEDQSTSSWVNALSGKRTNPPRDPDAIATRRSVFDDPCLATHYWPKQDYENIHRFDSSAG